MRHKITATFLVCLSLLMTSVPTVFAHGNTPDFSTIETVKTDIVDLDMADIQESNLEALGLDEEAVQSLKVKPISAECSNRMVRSGEASTLEIGALISESYDDDLDMKDTTYTVVFDEDGEAMSASRLAEYMGESGPHKAYYAQMKTKAKIYTDGFAELYVNPYEITLVQTRAGCSYLGGRLRYHGTQVTTSDFKDIPGTDCSDAIKFWAVSAPITVGKEYSNTGYYYSSGKALRACTCPIHGMGSKTEIYMEYQVGTEVYKFNF